MPWTWRTRASVSPPRPAPMIAMGVEVLFTPLNMRRRARTTRTLIATNPDLVGLGDGAASPPLLHRGRRGGALRKGRRAASRLAVAIEPADRPARGGDRRRALRPLGTRDQALPRRPKLPRR